MNMNRIACTLAAAALAAICVAAPAPQSKPETKPNLVFGVVSDLHVRLSPDATSLVPSYNVDTFEKALRWYDAQGIDALVVAGDMADSGLVRELKAVADAWFGVFPGDKAADGRHVERLFVFGNHDALGMIMARAKRVFPDKEERRRETMEGDPQKAWRDCFGEDFAPYYSRTVKGYRFFCSHWEPGVHHDAKGETASAGCVAAFAGEMAKCDPGKPFFYVQHPHPGRTLYVNGGWGHDDGSAVSLLSRFPQAIAFSGHSHEPVTDERALWRGAFTSIGTGSLRYLSASHHVWSLDEPVGYENGVCQAPKRNASTFDAPKMMPSELSRNDIRVGLLVSVYDDRVVVKRREFLSGLDLGEDWVLPIPARPMSFEERAKASPPPQFPEGATLAAKVVKAMTRGVKDPPVEPVEKPALRLDFPAATQGGHAIEYEIAVEGDEGKRFSTRICAIGGLYPPGHPKSAQPERAIIALDRLPAGAKTAIVTPLDSFGNRGRSLKADLAM